MKRAEGKLNCGYDFLIEDYESFHEIKSINDNREYQWGCDAHGMYEAVPGRDVTQEYSFEQIFNGSDLFDKWYRDAKMQSDRELKQFFRDFHGTRAQFDFVGQSVSVPRAMQGHPMAFSHRKPDIKKRKVIQIDWDVSVRWSYDTENRIKNACTFIAVAKALEAKGYAVNITAGRFCIGDNRDLSITTVPLKDYHTPVNERKVLYPLGAKASLFHCFVWADQRTPGSKRKCGDGSSLFYESDHVVDEVCGEFAKKGRILIGHALVDQKLTHRSNDSVDFETLLNYILERAERI